MGISPDFADSDGMVSTAEITSVEANSLGAVYDLTLEPMVPWPLLLSAWEELFHQFLRSSINGPGLLETVGRVSDVYHRFNQASLGGLLGTCVMQTFIKSLILSRFCRFLAKPGCFNAHVRIIARPPTGAAAKHLCSEVLSQVCVRMGVRGGT